LGLASSPALVREPQGNGCAERLIRTLKENLRWLTTFDTMEELQVARLECRQCDNATWLIGRQRDNTPLQVRQEQQAARAQQVA
jgi:putative transposase